MEKLNLNQFLQDPAEHLGHYTLHAVLVHSGKCRASFIVGKKDQKNKLNQLLHVCMLPYSFHCSFRMSKYNNVRRISRIFHFIQNVFTFNFTLNKCYATIPLNSHYTMPIHRNNACKPVNPAWTECRYKF